MDSREAMFITTGLSLLPRPDFISRFPLCMLGDVVVDRGEGECGYWTRVRSQDSRVNSTLVAIMRRDDKKGQETN